MQDIVVKDSTRVVTYNGFIHSIGLQKLKIKERKLLYIAISQCRKTDREFYEYRLSIKEFAELMEIDSSNIYQEADEITTNLMGTVISWCYTTAKKRNRIRKSSLFSYIDYDIEDYHGDIVMKLNPEMTDLLLQLKGNFTQPLLVDFLRMKSPYSIAIWHLMQEKMKSKKPYGKNTIDFYLSLGELRHVTGTEKKFIQIGQFKEKVLDKAIREIKDSCGVIVNYSNVKSNHTIIGFDFTASSRWCQMDKMTVLQEK